MLTIKRIYLYGVLGVSLVLLLWGLIDFVRFVFEEIGRALGVVPAFGEALAREDLSLAVALVLVAGVIFGVHLALVRRTLRGTSDEVADERASASRATYFFLVLIGTGAALFLALYDFGHQLILWAAFDGSGLHPHGALAAAVVAASAWALHLRARAGDLRAAPERTAGDWLTRGYLYGALFAMAVYFAVESGDMLTTVARRLLDLAPLWEDYGWWEDGISAAVSGTAVAAAGWLTHWVMANRLLRAPDPMGEAHRTALTRRGYFIVVILASAAAALVLGALGLRELIGDALGAWDRETGSHLIADAGGPLLMIVPFAIVGWWHGRRVAQEANAMGGNELARSVVRTTRLVVAAVGLAGLSAGLAWGLKGLFDTVGGSASDAAFTSSSLAETSADAFAFVIVGLILWLPAWLSSQRERAQHTVEAAVSTSRRAYLMLVSGLAVIAAMGSLAYLVWQATRVLLDSGELEDPSWAFGVLIVAVVVLGYHLWQLRSDLAVAHAAEGALPAAEATSTGERAHETIKIIAPAGADFRVLNAAIRSELPEGYELRVVSHTS